MCMSKAALPESADAAGLVIDAAQLGGRPIGLAGAAQCGTKG